MAKEDQETDANILIISKDILTKKEEALIKIPAMEVDKNAVKIKPMERARDIVPNRITAKRVAITVMEEILPK